MVYKGSKASLAIDGVLRNLSASYEICFQHRLLQAKMLPILLYDAELTGLSDTKARSTAFLRQIKSFLCVRRSTKNAVVLAEVEFLPLAAYALERALIYFIKLKTVFNHQSSSLHIQAIREQISMARSELPCWGRDIMLLLGKLNMLQLWTTVPTSLPRAINDIAFAIKFHGKSWLNSEIATTRCYSLLYLPMSPFAPAAHLSAGFDKKFRIALTRLRTGPTISLL